ncbi:Tyrosine/DOPA decarboxylase 2-like protein [Drosera capensis]
MGSLDNATPKGSTLCTKNPLLDPEEFRRQGHMIVDFLADYYRNVENYPVRSQAEPGYLKKRLPNSAPYYPEPIETILKDVQSHIIPGLTHWQSPNHFAYFPSSASIAGILGETLVAGITCCHRAGNDSDGLACRGFSLPKSFMFSGNGGGVLLGTTCEALLTTIVATRDRALSTRAAGSNNRFVVYGSDQTHCSFHKSAKIAGINPNNIRKIKTTNSSNFGLRADLLRLAVKDDVEAGLIPLFLCATVGTISTTAVDPIGSLCDVANEYGMWVHIDAAYGMHAFARSSEVTLTGVEGADSFSFIAHKWFFTSLDCCCLWVKDPKALRNKESDSNQVVDYKDWQIALSRRFRSLKLWLVLRSYGICNLRKFIRKHVDMAAYFEGLVNKDSERFEVVVPRLFSTVCFRISPATIIQHRLYNRWHDHEKTHALPASNDHDDHNHILINDINQELLESVNASGRLYMTHGFVDGMFLIRFSVGASLTEQRHIINAWKTVQEYAQKVVVLLRANSSSSKIPL